MNNLWTGGQYSVFRVLFGAYLVVHFLHLLPWAPEIFSNAGVIVKASDSPLINLFPNILALYDAPWFISMLVVSAALASLALLAGWHDKGAAIWIWYVLACLFGRDPLIANPSLPYVGWMLLAHLFIPKAPYGSWTARGRVDPGGGWSMPKGIFLAAWIVLALSYSYSGYTKLLSPSWVDGHTISYVLQNPLARDYFLRDFFLGLPPIYLQLLTWAVMWIELLFAPLVLLRALRPLLWGAMLFVQFGFAFLLNFADLTLAMLLFHFLTFDPAWVRPYRAARREYVFYDGHCGLCHRVIRFLLAEDAREAFRFAPLQSDAFQRAVREQDRNNLPDSFVVLNEEGGILLRSSAAVYVLHRLGGVWRLLGMVLWCLPRFIRNAGYDFIGGIRHRLFRRPDEVCPIIPAHLRSRFA
jgi:predicted DCC family thiol-disulfide oxidoreductase YuxK